MKAVLSAALGAAFFVTGLPPAEAAPCYPRNDILELLERNYGEVPVGRALATSGVVVELLVSPQGESWTLVVTLPNGITCAALAGEHWEQIATRPGGERS